MIYAVDIDGTLCKEEHRYWEYHLCKPYKRAINKINALFGQGHKIILHTSRPEKDRLVTMRWLKEQGVRYHDLVMDKPRADIYIDNASRRINEL